MIETKITKIVSFRLHGVKAYFLCEPLRPLQSIFM